MDGSRSRAALLGTRSFAPRESAPSEQEPHMLLISMHHIISDEWSMGVLIHELSTLYAAFEQGHPSPLPKLAIQYADYAVWQRSWLADSVIEAELEFWIDRLTGTAGILELPTDRPPQTAQRHHGRVRSFHLDRDLADRLGITRRQSRERRCS